MKKYILPLVIVIGIGIVAAAILYKRYNIPPYMELTAISLSDLKGHPVSISSYGGEPIFINFFASWCGPCIKEMPELSYLKSKLANQQLQVLCVSDEPIEKLQALQARFGDDLIFLHSDKPLHDLGIYTYPTNYIFNTKGEKVYANVNTEDWESDEVVLKIRRLMK